MVKKMKKTNPILIALIQDLKKKSYENDAPIWKDISLRLEKPSKNWPEVNLNRIDRYIKENEDKYGLDYALARSPGAKDDVKQRAEVGRKELQQLLDQLNENFDPGINLLRRQAGLPAISRQTSGASDGFGKMTVTPTKTP